MATGTTEPKADDAGARPKWQRFARIGGAVILVGLTAWFIFPYLGWRRKQTRKSESAEAEKSLHEEQQ